MTQLTKNAGLGKVTPYGNLSGKPIGNVGAAKHPVLSHEHEKYSAAFTSPDHHIGAANLHHVQATEHARAGRREQAEHHQKLETWHRRKATEMATTPQIGRKKR